MRYATIVERHERCPRCASRGEDRSGDNLAVYQDGHVHCFKCGLHRDSGGLSISSLHSRIKQKEGNTPNGTIALPADYTADLAEKGLNWLRKYDITDQEIEDNRFGWSKELDALVFPIYDVYNNLLMVQNRKFSDPKRKYYTSGYPEKVYHILGNMQLDAVVVVEDLVSAIKVARITPAMPLWGSNIHQNRFPTLGNRFKELFIWLDKDKAEYAIKRKLAGGPYFDSVRAIVTDKDPKEYNETEIQEILNG